MPLLVNRNLKCSPNKESTATYTCFSKVSLMKIAKIYNKTHKIKKVKLSQTKRALYDNLVVVLGYNENKWPDISYVHQMNNKEINNTLRPKKPISWCKDKKTWLSTPELTNVMTQYEKKYKDFKYLGTVPVDCPVSVQCELSNMNLQDLQQKKKTKLGIIFNLDTHNKPGSHWVALFINISNSTISYYDSYGIKYPIHITKFISRLSKQFKNMHKKSIIQYNKKRHQYGTSECGIYSINFIIESLKGTTLTEISKQTITDKTMNNMRDILYR
jgi:hypothetical protein